MSTDPTPAGPPPDGPPSTGPTAGGGPPPQKRGRPKKRAAELRTGQFRVRVSVAEKAGIERAAGEAGLSVSEYLRRRALGRPVEARVDAAARGLLRRLGVNLNQLVRVAHRAGQVEHGDELVGVLAEVRAAVRTLELGPSEPHPGRVDDGARSHPFPWGQG